MITTLAIINSCDILQEKATTEVIICLHASNNNDLVLCWNHGVWTVDDRVIKAVFYSNNTRRMVGLLHWLGHEPM